jgi:uncharacterized protein (DUF488 family)
MAAGTARGVKRRRSRPKQSSSFSDRIFTVGHSTRPIEDFVRLLQAHGVRLLVDVRTIPRSRHNPQFNQDALRAALQRARLSYRHMKGLGGLRHARKDSKNMAWRNAGFRGFADYMQTPEFSENVQRLMELSRTRVTAIMCAEAVPWRCHRSLIGDALLVRGFRVEELSSLGTTKPHTLTPWARVRGLRITYPAGKPPAQRKTARKRGEQGVLPSA